MRARTFLTILGATAATACYGDPVAGPPYRAQIIDLVGVDPGSGEAEFSLVTREFTFLDDLDALSAPELRVYRGGTLEIREVAGSVVLDGSFSDPGAPDLRYIDDGGVAVPRDYPTLAMLSAYYQYERVLAGLERVSGLTVDELGDRIGQIQVFFEPSIEFDGEGAEQTVVQKFNAFYVPGNQQFGLAQRSVLESVPLAMNRQVIAHEFGHALFEQTFQQNQLEDCDPDREVQNANDPTFPGRFTVEYAISGVNEGFADFISFAYTGGTNPVAALPFDGVSERDIERTEFSFADLVGTGEACEGQFYCIGTLFARSLHDTFVALGHDPLDPEARGAFAREVVAAMAGAKAAMRDLGAGVLPLPDGDAAACERHDGLVRAYDGEIAGAFLSAFTSEMPAASRAPLCDALTQNFGDGGFPEPARAPCPEATRAD